MRHREFTAQHYAQRSRQPAALDHIIAGMGALNLTAANWSATS
jgi:hypothetical protein